MGISDPAAVSIDPAELRKIRKSVPRAAAIWRAFEKAYRAACKPSGRMTPAEVAALFPRVAAEVMTGWQQVNTVVRTLKPGLFAADVPAPAAAARAVATPAIAAPVAATPAVTAKSPVQNGANGANGAHRPVSLERSGNGVWKKKQADEPKVRIPSFMQPATKSGGSDRPAAVAKRAFNGLFSAPPDTGGGALPQMPPSRQDQPPPEPLSPEAKQFRARVASREIQDKLIARGVNLTKRKDTAQDLVQEACMRAIAAFDKGGYVERGNLIGWMMVIMTNFYKNELRKDRRKGWVRLDLGAFDPASPAEQDHNLYLEDALNTIRGLPVEQQEVLWPIVMGEPYRKVAASSDVASGTVKSRVARARKVLREAHGD